MKRFTGLSIVVLMAFSISMNSCYKEPDLSGYMTLEQWQAWQVEHENDFSGYMTLEQWQAWQAEHGNDFSGYMTLEQWQAWLATHSNLVTVTDFNVTFPAANDVYQVTTTYTGLQGNVSTNDVVLVYFNTSYGWMQLPFEYGNNSYVYGRANNGKLTFRKGRAVHITFTDDAETWQTKAVVIPATIYNKMAALGVDHDSYEAVAEAYNLQR